MRDGCDYRGDQEQCVMFYDYCKVNKPQSTTTPPPTTTAKVATTEKEGLDFEGFIPRNKSLCKILYKNCTTTNFIVACLEWYYYCVPPASTTTAPTPKGGIFEKAKSCAELHDYCLNKIPLSYYDCLQYYYFCLKRSPTTTTTTPTTTKAPGHKGRRTMTSNNVLKNSNALGQSKEDIVYFKVVSNTDDFPNNDESDFRVNPYGGVQFDERFQWNASAISASVPFE